MKKDSKTKDLSILFRENYKDWFRHVGVKIKGRRPITRLNQAKRSMFRFIKKRKLLGVAEKERQQYQRV